MLICVSGDTHGALDRLYSDVAEFEKAMRRRFEALLHVGDFGIWPDPKKVDRATLRHEGAGDFPRWLAEVRRVPLTTWFIKGNHEDFEWIDSRPSAELIPGLHYIANGCAVDIESESAAIRIAGIGGCFGPSDYGKRSKLLQGWAKRHYTLEDVEKAISQTSVDILLLHDAPLGVKILKRRGSGQETLYPSPAEGLDRVISSLRPRVCFFGHHHTRMDTNVAGVPCLGLNIVGRPGYLVAVEVQPRGRDWNLLGEWPERGKPVRPVWPKDPSLID